MPATDFVEIRPDGTASLADGRRVCLVAGSRGMLGYRLIGDAEERASATSNLDQVGQIPERDYFKVDIDQ